jgi:hypothetical protein
MEKYKILGADQKEYGPVTADVLRQWIAQGRAVSNTSVQVEGSTEWKPLSSYPEFADAFAATQLPPLRLDLPAGPPKTSGLAIASLICGILGFLCLPAIAGIILGIMALVKIGNSQGRLKGNALAIIGISLSVLMLLIVPAGLLLPALGKAHEKARRVQCVNNMKQIGLAVRLYSQDNKEIYPTNFQSMSMELGTPRILWCPADTKHTVAMDWPNFNPGMNLSYEYLKPGIAESNAMNTVIMRCPIHDNILMGDGAVQMLNNKGQTPNSNSR